MDVELAHDAFAVGFDRPHADAEAVGDLFVEEAFRDEGEHFAFAIGEWLLFCTIGGPATAVCHFLNENLGDGGAEVDFAVVNRLDRANEFGALLRQEGERAQRDLELTTASTEAVIELAQRMLYQQRQAQRVHEVPMTPSQALAVNDDEVHYNDEQQDAADDSIGARHQMFGRRLGDPGVMLFHLPESRRSADRVLGLLRAGSQHWPLAAGSGMSQEATTIGSSIEALLRGGVSVDAMELVVRSLYETNTRAFNEYTEWLEQRFDEGPAQASSSQGGGSLDFGGGSPDFGGGSPGFDGGSPGFDGGSPDYTGLYDPDDPFQ